MLLLLLFIIIIIIKTILKQRWGRRLNSKTFSSNTMLDEIFDRLAGA